MTIHSQYKPSNWRLFSVVLLAAIGMLPGNAHSYDVCDNKVESGEPVGQFHWLELGVTAYILAEKFCGAPATGTMSSKFLGAVERQGCGPDTPIYSELKREIARLEGSDLETLMQAGDPTAEITPEQVEKHARAGVEVFGGCPALLKLHKEDFE